MTSVRALRQATSTHIERFFARENPSSTLTQPVAFPSDRPNPFAPTKEPRGDSWRAPKYSLRRQETLRKEVQLLGLPEDVLPPPYEPDQSKKARRGDAAESPLSKAASSPSNQRADDASARSVTAPTLEPTDVLPKSKVLEQVAIERKGPYAGRRGPAFKGKIWERKFEARQAQVKDAASEADAKIAAHRKAEAEWRQKHRAKLPF